MSASAMTLNSFEDPSKMNRSHRRDSFYAGPAYQIETFQCQSIQPRTTMKFIPGWVRFGYAFLPSLPAAVVWRLLSR